MQKEKNAGNLMSEIFDKYTIRNKSTPPRVPSSLRRGKLRAF